MDGRILSEHRTRRAAEKVIMSKHSAAVELGKAGGVKGGPARARRLSKEARRKIASEGAKARNRKYGNPRSK